MGLNAQTPYFYYYNGEKQYLELDTKHIFMSVMDENAAKTFASSKANTQPLRADLPEKIQSNTDSILFPLSFSGVLEEVGEVYA